MGLFSKKPKLSQNEVAFKMANNVFKNVVTTDETYEKVIQGKGPAENLIFSVGILAATPKKIAVLCSGQRQNNNRNHSLR